MLKIILPPKVPCWKCSVGLYRCENLDRDVMACDCEDGWRYDFDDLAAAVIKKEHCFGYPYVIGIYPKAFAPQKIKDNYMVMVRGIQGEGPTPTAALLAAINKFNEEAEGDG